MFLLPVSLQHIVLFCLRLEDWIIMISVGKHKSTQNSLPSDICFDLYLETWKEASVHKNVCPNSSVIERHKGVVCLYKVRSAEERRDLVPSVTSVSTNNLDLGYCWSLFVKGTCRQQYCQLLLHLDSESEKSLLGRWIQHLSSLRWTMKEQVAMEER